LLLRGIIFGFLLLEMHLLGHELRLRPRQLVFRPVVGDIDVLKRRLIGSVVKFVHEAPVSKLVGYAIAGCSFFYSTCAAIVQVIA